MAWPNNVTEKDLRIDYYRGSGTGGQKKNKTSSACRIVHIPTGLMACAEDSRSQRQNRKNAFRRLADKLGPLMKEALSPPRPQLNTATVRSYREKESQVIDSRIDGVFDYWEVLDGKGLDKIIEALIKE